MGLSSELRRVRTALVSVFQKQGLEPLAKVLKDQNVKVFSTAGTKAFLQDLGLNVIAIEDITGFTELLDGRVKTLHPAVMGAILSRRTAADNEQIQHYGMEPIDLVVVDLYPFEETVAAGADHQKVIEQIDIGGVALLRAAAKNFMEVLICPSHKHYATVADLLSAKQGQTTQQERQHYAAEAFALASRYDALIARYLSGQTTVLLHELEGKASGLLMLRYGENPHQQGNFYGDLTTRLRQLGGKQLSYNNLLDADAALGLLEEFSDPTCVIVKHTNACGCASAADVTVAYRRAYASDPQSAFGGVIAVNRIVGRELAETIHDLFFEMLIAPSFADEALELLQHLRQRILLQQLLPIGTTAPLLRSALGGLLVQQADQALSKPQNWKVVTRIEPKPQHVADLLFAEKCVKHLKSNAIALVRNQQLVGMGCGQPSRIDAVHQALARAERNGLGASQAVMASDAFFPFPDSIEAAAAAGIIAILQPGGSRRDAEVIEACNRLGLAMVFTGLRHFRH
ncbi:MAG: bifunctional phosphoribosylaminoimidazolecarboxamide formyltransferase/IMP cyclohydrolase [Chitinophagales bacterium]|nr:bifunctional phosphoribosylaminoimidazolecarboxamide formyltransferase/IMP cyclohydrolase [Chitinophagales bacterium]MDW8427826.1 bifunctional phosphoribosylaminoimidazolecarboxamide formyltransferase/IMP cyclohydrolase [Chitinophagales bacterium]